MPRRHRKPKLVPVGSLGVGDKYYVNIVGIDYDEFEILDIDPVGNVYYRNNNFEPARTLFCPYDGSLKERLVHAKKPSIQIPLFSFQATVQTDLFE